jgi:hypothetical protein
MPWWSQSSRTPAQVAGGLHERAARVLHRLHDQHGDRLGARVDDRLLELVEQEARELLLALPIGAPVAVRIRHVQHVRHERLEGRAQPSAAVDRERAHRRPVVGDAPRDRLPAPLAARRVILAGKLPSGLDRLGAAAHEERAIDVAGREPGELGRQLDRARVRERPVDRERQLAHLLRRRLTHLGAEAVAGVDAEEPGERVQIALALRVLEVAALATDDDLELVCVQLSHAREVQPEVAEGVPPRGCPHSHWIPCAAIISCD